jgi:hypothetical protein
MPKDTINNRLKLVDEIVQEFTAELLNDLAKQGLDGEEFVAKVKEITGRIPKAVKKMIEEWPLRFSGRDPIAVESPERPAEEDGDLPESGHSSLLAR